MHKLAIVVKRKIKKITHIFGNFKRYKKQQIHKCEGKGGATRLQGRRRMFITFRWTGGKQWKISKTISEDGSPALHHYVQRAVCLSWQGETRTTATHLCPPQEQPPAPSGKKHSHTDCSGLKEQQNNL